MRDNGRTNVGRQAFRQGYLQKQALAPVGLAWAAWILSDLVGDSYNAVKALRKNWIYGNKGAAFRNLGRWGASSAWALMPGGTAAKAAKATKINKLLGSGKARKWLFRGSLASPFLGGYETPGWGPEIREKHRWPYSEDFVKNAVTNYKQRVTDAAKAYSTGQ